MKYIALLTLFLVIGTWGLVLTFDDALGFLRLFTFVAGFGFTAVAMPITVASWLEDRRLRKPRDTTPVHQDIEPLNNDAHYIIGDDGELIELPDAVEKRKHDDTHSRN